MNSDLGFYWFLFKKRFVLFIFLSVVFSMGGLVYALLQPATYRSYAALLVESPQITGDLAVSTVQTDTVVQLDLIQKRLTSRSTLLAVAREFEVFGDAIDQMTPDDVVLAMRMQTLITTSSGRNQATAISISFAASDPGLAAAVANKYVDLILEENLKFRTGIAEQTEEFFQGEVDRLSEELDRVGAQILQFKSENTEALPDTYAYRLERMDSLQERAADYEREILQLTDQRDTLREQIGTGQQEEEQVARPLSPQEQSLADLRQELAEATETLPPSSPRIRILRSRVAQLEEIVTSIDPTAAPAAAGEEIESQVRMLNNQIAFLTEALNEIEEEFSEIEVTVNATPTISIELEALEREYENIQEQYTTASGRLAQARTGERIELLAQGERITVTEQAVPPSRPESRSKMKTAIAATVASGMLALAIVFALELSNTSIRRPKQLITELGITPLATLPLIVSPGRRRLRFAMNAVVLLILMIGVPATLAALHMYYMPLGDLVADLADRLNA